MLLQFAKIRILSIGLMICLLSSCFHPPFNQFKRYHRTARNTAVGTVVGAAAGAVVGGTLSSTVIGGAIGGTVVLVNGIQKDSKKGLVRQLKRQDVQFVEYGDTMTLVVPTDKYFLFNSPRINELCYPGLNNIVRLLRLYPKSPIYVAGFTDNVGSRYHKKMLSQAQAETMMTFLWANNIKAMRLKAEGYADKNDISDNELIHGSAQNRRIEIQWFTGLVAQEKGPVFFTK